MHIKVNGTTQELSSSINVAELITQLQLDSKQVAVERNRQIVPKSTYGAVTLQDGDEIEIVRFIGGG